MSVIALVGLLAVLALIAVIVAIYFPTNKTRKDSDAYVLLSMSGKLTDRPQVSVGIHSPRGMISVMTQNATEQGNALAQLHAESLAQILNIELVDER